MRTLAEARGMANWLGKAGQGRAATEQAVEVLEERFAEPRGSAGEASFSVEHDARSMMCRMAMPRCRGT